MLSGKSTRAKCHGPPPCNGTPMAVGTLRYGHTITGEYGETVEWRHWGCVTPAILSQLAMLTMGSISGFQGLTPQDQQKIRLAISLRRIDPADVPESAKAKPVTTPAAAGPSARPSQQKRKAEHDLLSASQSSSTSPPLATQIVRDATRRVEDEPMEEVDEEEVKDEVYCTMNTNVVGIQYYKGLVGPGEEVLLVREPANPYDRNAIQVKNIGQTQVGHLPRNIALRLAPLLDKELVTVEGVINDGNLTGRKGYTLSITLRIYGASDARDSLEPQLIWATPGQRGFSSRQSASSASRQAAAVMSASQAASYASAVGPSTQRPGAPARTAAQQEAIRKQQEALKKAAELKQMLNNLEKVDDESRRSSLLDTLCSTDDILNLPLHPNPPGIKNGNLKVDLLKHQSQALQWCIEREYPALPKKETDKPVQFWQLRKTNNKPYYYNIATKTPQESAPLLGRGALCADAMGKTLTMLALILATKADVPPDYSNSTLIVAPLSVLSNWEKQVLDHCTSNVLSVCVYYGSNRSMSPEQLGKYDVVITTYQTVTGEHPDTARDGHVKKKKKIDRTLFDVQWKRIILDEGHTVRNPKTKMAKAVCGLSAQRRWVLTGTPIINSPRDLGSILTFLRICRPLDNEDFYKRLLLRPLKDGDPTGVELLRALMSHICIRRTKEMQDSAGNALIPLPPVEMIIIPVTLSEEARVLYDEVEQLSKQRFEDYMNRGTNAVVQSNVLSMLTRMRQLALHPGLVPKNYLQELQTMATEEDGISAPVIHLTPEDRLRLQALLAVAIEDFEECPICFGVLNEPRITSCGHMFCLPCIAEVISRDPKCPMDRRQLGMGDLIEPLPPTELTQAPVRREGEEEPDASGIRAGSSAKIDQLVHLLRLSPSTEKSLVFSQFTSFLDKIAETLEAEGIPYVRFDGQMSAKRRQETIARFSIPLPDGEGSSIRSRIVNDEDDYVMDGSDDGFLDDEDDNCAFSGKRKGKKSTKMKGKGRASTSNRRSDVDGSSFGGENPKVMLLSLKAGAVGLNLTVANNVYLMDPWWQEGIESQAVDRVNRIGQEKPVHVYQLIAENTVEAKVIEIQERKKQLIQQAFSGIKRTETQRHQREARLQDLIELFGIRQQNSQQH
ncbi:DNA repair protein rad5 [Hypsizygus marmoreus]|uniref:DNA repair protein rad5 n=1 Tax=Hypsizygus marmoreus TaxID=39966 RepID=A0A369JV93_HYPMA|nr:DNA repair protein rad5 [Hypsizygus marmoreus]